MNQNEDLKTSPRSVTPPLNSSIVISKSPSRSKSPAKKLFSLKFSPKRTFPDNTPISPTGQSKSNPNSPHNSSTPSTPSNPSTPRSPSSPSSPTPNSSPRVASSPNTPPNMMSFSPMRQMGINFSGNNQSAPETPNITPRAPVLLKSISSPRQRRSSFSTFGLFIRSSPPKKGSNLLNSSSTDEIKRSDLSESPPPSSVSPRSYQDEIKYLCHQCRKNLTIDDEKEKFLAVKCGCDGPPCYFCTRECYISHWITRNTRGLACEYNKFQEYLKKMNRIAPDIKFPLACPLNWDDQEHIHLISEYLSTTYLD